eukprot:CAMPEP_0167819930 /NCGR_PEP_ID=MMETSP0112_2-20121227/5749_1 /TAXON_ID=91324 /ORGANISM="Lotharella globosa, Strain CCCM811" /LENGTH=434 /DNA_ID=CAMNT_0007720311 /DNA_START=144 /DNA_END=1448 /DNA_ORIENTATION=-
MRGSESRLPSSGPQSRDPKGSSNASQPSPGKEMNMLESEMADLETELQKLQMEDLDDNDFKKASQYVFGPMIGKGAHGKVHSARRKQDGTLVAIKLIRLGEEGYVPATVVNEVKALRLVQHPNIIKPLDIFKLPHSPCASTCCEKKSNTLKNNKSESRPGLGYPPEELPTVVLVQELAPRGDLYSLCHHGALPETVARYFFQQLIAGVAHLHSRSVVHRDIKPENLAIDAELNLKIIDFGLAAADWPGSSDRHFEMTGTLPYSAPEVYYNSELFDGDGYQGGPADLWSCAVVLYVMLTGSIPFRRPLLINLGEGRQLQRCPHFAKIMNGVWSKRVPEAAVGILAEMLVLDPKKRLTTRAVQRHKWFGGEVPEKEELESVLRGKTADTLLPPPPSEECDKGVHNHVRQQHQRRAESKCASSTQSRGRRSPEMKSE